MTERPRRTRAARPRTSPPAAPALPPSADDGADAPIGEVATAAASPTVDATAPAQADGAPDRVDGAALAPNPTPVAESAAVPERRRWLAGRLARTGAGVAWVRRQGTARDALAVALLGGLTLAFYRALIFTDRIAADPLLTRLVYPYRQFAADALRDGRLPLWNPYLFTGVPFLADPQAAVLYPPNLALRWLDAPQAVALSVVAHGLFADVATYCFARVALGVVRPAAFTGAVVFAFGGFVGANAVEPNVVEASAWLPLVLLGVSVAQRGRTLLGVLIAAVALALQILAGQPHVAALTVLAAGLLLALHALPPAVLTGRPSRRRLRLALVPVGRSLAIVIAVLVLAAALAAAQLVPGWELFRRSVRADGLTLADATAGALTSGQFVRSLLPGFNEDPERLLIGYTGIIALGLGIAGLRRGSAGAAFGLMLMLAGLCEALGEATPVFGLVHRISGGWLAFDHPTRGLLLVGFGGAVAAAVGLDSLWPVSRPPPPTPAWARRWPVGAFALVGLALGAYVVARHDRIDLPTPGVREIWLGLGIIAMDVALVLPLTRPRRWLALLLTGAVVLELLIAGAQLPFTRTATPASFDVEPALAPALRGDGAPARLARVGGIAETDPPPAPGFAEYDIARDGRDRLAPDTAMLDRVDTLEGLRTALIPPGDVIRALGGAATQPAGAPYPSLGVLPGDVLGSLGPRLGVTHVLGPPRQTVTAGLAAFVLGVPLELRPGEEARIELLPARLATGASFLTDVDNAPPEGEPAVEVVLTEASGAERRRTLVSGIDTGDVARLPAGRAATLPDGSIAVASEQPLGFPAVFRALTIRNISQAGTLQVRAVSLFDERTGASSPVLLNDVVRPIAGTDPTLYEDTRTPPRLSLVREYTVDPDVEGTIARLVSLPLGTVVLDRPPRFSTASADDAPPPAGDRVTVTQYEPERVEAVVTAAAPAVLVLRDSAYPGWRALVDGRPVELLRADGLFRAVAVPAGTHTVAFEFQPDSLRIGAAVSAVTAALVLMAALALLPLPRRRRAPDAQRGTVTED